MRHRKNDLPLLIQHFVQTYAERCGKRIAHIPPRARSAGQSYGWPGNVRELQHVIERAVILTRGSELAFEELSVTAAPADELRPLAGTLEDAERAHILKALDAADWRVSGPGGAAERLGLKASTLQFRIKKLGITRPA